MCESYSFVYKKCLFVKQYWYHRLQSMISSFLLFAMEIQDSRGGKKQNSQNASEHDYLAGSESYIKVQGPRKLECPANLQVHTIQSYVDYTLPLN